MKRSMFISYSQKQMDFANSLEAGIDEIVEISRDCHLPSGKRFLPFMNSIQFKDYAVLLISQEYLISINCMYELSRRIKAKDWPEHTYLVTFPGANIYEAYQQIHCMDYWTQKLQEHKANFGEKDPNNDYQKMVSICEALPKFFPELSDIKNLYPENAVKEIINKISTYSFFDCKNIEELFSRGIETFSDITQTDYNQVILCAMTNPYSIGLVVFADKISASKQQYRIVIQEGLISSCFASGSRIVVNDVKNQANYFQAVPETLSEAVLPISYKGHVLGVFNSESDKSHYFDEIKLAKLESAISSFSQQLISLGYRLNVYYRKFPYISLSL